MLARWSEMSGSLRNVGDYLCRERPSRIPFTIHVIESDEINAFSLPGGYSAWTGE